MVGWKETLHKFAIQPVQQFRFTVGKNATDSALIIDAMDLLHGGTVDGFCLVSSDSDFTRLATRVREAGLSVYGFGEKKTPQSFVAACDKFVFTEILRPPKLGKFQLPSTADPLQPALESAVDAATREDGWAALSAVGGLVMKASPSFDSRNYGLAKLGELVRAQPYLEVKSVADGEGAQNLHLYVRGKDA